MKCRRTDSTCGGAAARRGALCHDEVTSGDSIDFLQVDWFDIASLPLDEAQARF